MLTAQATHETTGFDEGFEIEAQIAERENSVMNEIRSGKLSDALVISLQNPPYHAKSQELKDRNFQVVLAAISAASTRDAGLREILASIGIENADTLMKYVYKGLQFPAHSSLLLRVHTLLVEIYGKGPIVRCIFDRCSV